MCKYSFAFDVSIFVVVSLVLGFLVQCSVLLKMSSGHQTTGIFLVSSLSWLYFWCNVIMVDIPSI